MALSPLSRRAGMLSLTAAVLTALSQVMRLASVRLLRPALSTPYQIPLAIAIGWIGLTLESESDRWPAAAPPPGPTFDRAAVQR